MTGRFPRLMIAAAASGSGKTTLTCALLQALANRGLRPAAFKCGPDYIDPMFHREAIGAKAANLDLFFLPENDVRALLAKTAQGCGISVLEGVMGFYDGLGGSTVTAGSYDLARATQTPVILCLDCTGLSLTAAALVRGLQSFRTDSQISGVILNKCSAGIYAALKTAIEAETGLPVLGYLPKRAAFSLGNRHLGLITAAELPDLRQTLAAMANALTETVDLDKLLTIAEYAPPLQWEEPPMPPAGPPVRVAVATDRAFCFYYQESLELLRSLGAELLPFSPINDAAPPDCQGLLLGGGYPELYARELSENRSMRTAIRKLAVNGTPILAECGGFLYLQQELETEAGIFSMAEVLPGRGYPQKGPRRFGYCTLNAQENTSFCGQGMAMPAHEFHYWDSTDCGAVFHAEKPVTGRSWNCCQSVGNVLAGFPHLYYLSNPAFAARFLSLCGNQKEAYK